MLRPSAKDVKPIDDYMLLVTFDNDEKKVFDVKPYMTGCWFSKLKDKAVFKTVRVKGLSVAWADGQDICPDELYYNSISE